MKSKKNNIILILMYAMLMLLLWKTMGKQQQQKQPTPKSTSSMMAQAEKLVEARKYKDAASAYQQIATENPQSQIAAQALLARGELYEHGDKSFQNKDEALKSYREIVQPPRPWYDRIIHPFSTGVKPRDYTIEAHQDGRAVTVSALSEAAERVKRLSEELDRQNSKDWRYQTIDFLVRATGRQREYSFALALLIMTLAIKIITTPLNKKQFKSMLAMQTLQPKLKEMQAKYKDKPEELNKRTFAMYKEEGVNPLGGCLPMLVQMPILIGLYSAIRLYEFQFANGSFLWIRSLAVPDFPLLIMYTISMFLSTKLTTMPTADPAQAQQQKMMSYMMPVMFLFIVGGLPSAFVLYWFAFNVITTWQQYHFLKTHKLATATVGGNGTAPAVSGSNGRKDIKPTKPRQVKPKGRSTKTP